MLDIFGVNQTWESWIIKIQIINSCRKDNFDIIFIDGSNRKQLRLQSRLTQGKASDSLSTSSLKQQQIKNISNELNNHKKEVQILRREQDTLESVLTMKTADVKKSLSNELVRIE